MIFRLLFMIMAPRNHCSGFLIHEISYVVKGNQIICRKYYFGASDNLENQSFRFDCIRCLMGAPRSHQNVRACRLCNLNLKYLCLCNHSLYH